MPFRFLRENLLGRFWVYCQERFPFWLILPLIILGNLALEKIFAPTAIFLSFPGSLPISFHFQAIFFLCLFNLWQYFVLRIFDEIKDYHLDLQLHPQRPISRDLISIKELSWFALIGFLGFLLWILIPNLLLIFWPSLAGFLLPIFLPVNCQLFLFSVTFFLFCLEISRRDYFWPNLRKNFFLYNFFNSTNTLAILGSTYLLWAGVSSGAAPVFSTNFFLSSLSQIWPLLVSHSLLTYGGSFLLELTRKGGEKSTDGYLHYLSKNQFFWLLQLAQSLVLLAFLAFLPFLKIWSILLLGILNLFVWWFFLKEEKFAWLKVSCLFFYFSALMIFYYALS